MRIARQFSRTEREREEDSHRRIGPFRLQAGLWVSAMLRRNRSLGRQLSSRRQDETDKLDDIDKLDEIGQGRQTAEAPSVD